MVSKDIHSGLWGKHSQEANLWVKSQERDEDNVDQLAFTELDVVYGESDVRWGWDHVTTVTDLPDPVSLRFCFTYQFLSHPDSASHRTRTRSRYMGAEPPKARLVSCQSGPC